MALTPIQETPASALAAGVNNSPPESPPLQPRLSKSGVDTPHHTPAAAAGSNTSATVQDTIENISEELVTERRQNLGPSADGEGTLAGGESLELGQVTVSQADVGKTEHESMGSGDDHGNTQSNVVSTLEVHLPVVMAKKEIDGAGRDQTLSNSRDEPTSDVEPCEILPEQLTPTQIAELEVPRTSGVDSTDNKDVELDSTNNLRSYRRAGQREAGRDIEDESFGDDEDTAVDTPDQSGTLLKQPQSVPPHMRPTLKAVSAQSTVETRVSRLTVSCLYHTNTDQRDWPAPVPRAPRAYSQAVTYPSFRPPTDYDELRRTKAQLMKARDDLEAERKLNSEMRKMVGAEKQASIGGAMSDMLTDLLQKQAEALTEKAKTQEKERRLQNREQQITQLEVYLSEGQKQLKYQLEQQGIRLMSTVDEANLRREVEIKVKHQLSDIEGKIAIQVERLRHQEIAQKIREQQYKVVIRDDLEKEVREQLARDMQAKGIDSKATDAAYERGLAEGQKIEGTVAVPELSSKHEFLKGYAACYRSQTALHNMRIGRLAVDSSELAFLYDPTHVENPHNIGVSIGRMIAEAPVSSSVGVVISPSSMVDGAVRAAAIMGESQATSSAVTLRGRGQEQFTDEGSPHTSHVEGRLEQAHPPQQTRLQPVQQQEELIRR